MVMVVASKLTTQAVTVISVSASFFLLLNQPTNQPASQLSPSLPLQDSALSELTCGLTINRCCDDNWYWSSFSDCFCCCCILPRALMESIGVKRKEAFTGRSSRQRKRGWNLDADEKYDDVSEGNLWSFRSSMLRRDSCYLRVNNKKEKFPPQSEQTRRELSRDWLASSRLVSSLQLLQLSTLSSSSEPQKNVSAISLSLSLTRSSGCLSGDTNRLLIKTCTTSHSLRLI